MASCTNCSKKIHTDNGMAFHLTWCKPAEPEPHPSGRDDNGEPEPSGPAFAHDFGQPCSCPTCNPSREFEFRPAEYTRYSAFGTSPEHAIDRIRGAYPDAAIDGRCIAYLVAQGRVDACVNFGPAVVEAASTARVLPAPKSIKAPAVKVAKMPASTGKHARCVHHEPMVRTAPGVAFACFDVQPSAADIAERRAFVAAIDASWNAMHEREMTRRASYGPGLANVVLPDQYRSRLLTPAEREAMVASRAAEAQELARILATSSVTHRSRRYAKAA